VTDFSRVNEADNARPDRHGRLSSHMFRLPFATG
jgi:hypothetical protein